MAARIAPSSDLGSRILKVNHAGEHGAVNIYTAQIFVARWTASGLVAELNEFRAHEVGHRSIFGAELARRGVRRCRSYWLCGVGGFVLGAVTGLFGKGAIAATTSAVESVVLRHLEHQLAELEGKDPLAVSAIASIVAEEQAHHDHSMEHVQPGSVWQRVLTPIVSASTKAVIWMGMRF